MRPAQTDDQAPNIGIYLNPKLNPDWDPLRGDPRFEALLTFLAPAKK